MTQLGIKSESTWGTAVTVDLFPGGWTGGNPTVEQRPLVSKAIRANRLLPHCISAGPKTVGGTVSMELVPQPMATIMRHMWGTINTTGANPYDHTASIGSVRGKSFTLQVGVDDEGGTPRVLTYSGCKIPSWKKQATAGEIATLEFEVSARDYVTNVALASASYTDHCPFTFVHGSVSVDGTELARVKSFEEAFTRPLRTDGHYIGSALVKEQLGNGQPELMTTIETEFTDLTLHDLANTTVEIILEFDNGTQTLTDTINGFVLPATPTVTAVETLTGFTFTALAHGSTDAAAATSVLHNAEASAA